MTPESKPPSLTAAYTSPDNQDFSVTKTLDPPASTSVQDRTAYLAALGRAVADAQQQINKELTARMEEDIARGASTGRADDEDREEENYGEEIQEGEED